MRNGVVGEDDNMLGGKTSLLGERNFSFYML